MNIKGGRKALETKLRGMRPTKKDLANIERIVLKRIEPADHYVQYANSPDKLSSARFLSNSIKYFRNIEVRFTAPNIRVAFKRFKTEVFAQRIYSKRYRLEAVDEAFTEIVKYLSDDRNARL